MKDKIEEVFDALQELDVKPTPQNVSILNGVYCLLREVFAELKEEGEDVGRAKIESEQPNNN